VPTILDNLITAGKIEPLIAVILDSYRTTRDTLLPLNFKFKDEFVSEFIPAIRSRYHASARPEQNIIGGMSYGGLAAAFIAFYHPDMFGNVLSQSGSFWRGAQLEDAPDDWLRFDWLIGQYASADNKKIRLYLDWGLLDGWIMESGRRMAKALARKGYGLRYVEFNGWHDWANSRKTFGDGIIYLLAENGK
jgi:enterochelin esterase-like enzyme